MMQERLYSTSELREMGLHPKKGATPAEREPLTRNGIPMTRYWWRLSQAEAKAPDAKNHATLDGRR